jgi:REP element-mobilizing transposase RayT
MSVDRRNVPHWQPVGPEYFVTFRLTGSLPKEVIAELKRKRGLLCKKFIQEKIRSAQRAELRIIIQRKIFKKYESTLDKGDIGPTWLKQTEVAAILKESIHYRDGKDYELYAYCIMPNHVHMVFRHLFDSVTDQNKDEFPVTEIMESMKKFTARRCNSTLNRTGQAFWQSESYDHVIRDADELERVIRYTIYNPVEAGLVSG